MLPPNTLALVGLSKPLSATSKGQQTKVSHVTPTGEIFNSIYIYNIYVDARLCVTISRQITYYISISHRKPPTKGDIPEPDRRPRGAARNAASIVEASRSEGGQYAPMTKYRSPPVASSRLTTFGLHVRCPSTWWVVESLQKRATPPFCAFTWHIHSQLLSLDSGAGSFLSWHYCWWQSAFLPFC